MKHFCSRHLFAPRKDDSDVSSILDDLPASSINGNMEHDEGEHRCLTLCCSLVAPAVLVTGIGASEDSTYGRRFGIKTYCQLENAAQNNSYKRVSSSAAWHTQDVA